MATLLLKYATINNIPMDYLKNQLEQEYGVDLTASMALRRAAPYPKSNELKAVSRMLKNM